MSSSTRIAVTAVAWCWILLAYSLTAASATAPQPPRFSLSAEQLSQLSRALTSLHQQYDPMEKMIRARFSSPGYHTTLKGGYVHPTRTSLQYSVALLDTGDEAFKDRACDILRRVIALQDQDPRSKTYGIWSWFLEEPLDQMSPPDWNWADFCGTQLLQVARDHGHRLPLDLRAQVEAAIQHAARSIQRRNVGPGYTNIAIMGAYVTLVTAEMFNLPDLQQYALARLRRFYDYTREHGAFTEYNSPTYTVVALEELGRMRRHVTTPEARPLIEEIYRLAWEEIALHFHPPTRQWAGPHSRCYQTLLGDKVLALFQRATDGRLDYGVDHPGLFDHRIPLPCPADLEPYLTELTQPRELIKTFVKAEPPIIGTTWLEPAFTLGSINRGQMWNQRRPLLAYWGTAEAPSYFRVRLLRDNYDFSAGQFFSVQRRGSALAGINFATDGGNTHISLDRLKNGMAQVRDLRVRFELGGAAAKAPLAQPISLYAPVTIKVGDIQIQLALAHAAFDDEKCQWEISRDKDTAGLDLVLYQGNEKTIDLSKMPEAVIGFAIRLGAEAIEFPKPTATLENNVLSMQWNHLSLALPTRPNKAGTLQKGVRTSIENAVAY